MTTMRVAMQKCRSCKATKPVTEFIRLGDKWKKRRGTCNDCAEKARANYLKRTSVEVSWDEKICLKCRNVKPLNAFIRRGAEYSSCNECSERAAAVSIQRAPGGTLIDGVPHRNCRKCGGLFPREEFRAGAAYTSACQDCRGDGSQRIEPKNRMHGYPGWGKLDFGPEVSPTDPLVDPFTDFARPEWRTA